MMVLTAGNDPTFSLFLRPKDPERERWDGARLGIDAALRTLGADAAFPIAEFEQRLAGLLCGHETLLFELGRFAEFDRLVLAAIRTLRRRARQGVLWPTRIVDPSTVIHPMRLVKDTGELALMDKAADVTCRGHIAAMAAARPGMFEYELEAILRSGFRAAGAQRMAYSPIVGSGTNATVLHHVSNDRRMLEGELVLIDAGCEFGYYAADVTRTFPVSGKFSAAQRAVYEIVLNAQKGGIDAARVGATLEAVHQASLDVLVDGLLDLRLLSGTRESIIEGKTYQRFYMHRTSHWLGMDVHDVGPYVSANGPIPLQAGMVLTVEPGLYIDSLPDVPEEFRGIGVRIEDDILVTEVSPRVLTSAAPKEVGDVEAACGAG